MRDKLLSLRQRNSRKRAGPLSQVLSIIPCFFRVVIGVQRVGLRGSPPTGGIGDDPFRRPLASRHGLPLGVTNHDRGARNGVAGIGWVLAGSTNRHGGFVHANWVWARLHRRCRPTCSDCSIEQPSEVERLTADCHLISVSSLERVSSRCTG